MSTFLDDQLFDFVMQKSINTPNDFQDMVNDLYIICEKKWKPQFYLGMKKSEVKIILDRTFAAWDLFIKRLRKENYFLVELLQKYSYKNQFMEDQKLKEIYNSL